MEPRPCGRGNTVREIIEAALAQLQWSHDLAVVETIEPIPLEEFGPFASMEPRPCGRGNFQQALVQAAAQNASMEPRPCGRGNLKVMLRTAAVHSFNGATTLRSWKRWRARKSCWTQLRLQWSHDLAVVETACTGPRTIWRWSGFNGATTLRSWKLDAAVAQRRVLVCFNGATTLRSWKQHRAEALVLIVLLASMEPRPCGRGNHEYKRGALHSGRLQWSHDLAVVETR